MIWSPEQLIFPVGSVMPAGPPPGEAETLDLATDDGATLRGLLVPPLGPAASPRTLLLGFGGNAWNAQHAAEYLHELFPERHVGAFHYRGYPPSTGQPSARALIADAPLVHDLAVERAAPERIVAVGFSIGSGVAAALASSRRLDGLILVTPFESLRAVAQDLFPWAPIGPFFTHEMDCAAFLESAELPVAIIAAERDDIVRTERTQALRKRVGNLLFDRTIAGAGHNDIYQRPEFHDALRDALRTLLGD